MITCEDLKYATNKTLKSTTNRVDLFIFAKILNFSVLVIYNINFEL